jgi:hypothetical protein
MTRRGTDIDQLRQFGVAEPPIALQQAKHFQIDPIEFSSHERIFHIFR